MPQKGKLLFARSNQGFNALLFFQPKFFGFMIVLFAARISTVLFTLFIFSLDPNPKVFRGFFAPFQTFQLPVFGEMQEYQKFSSLFLWRGLKFFIGIYQINVNHLF
jgi:hypothetical protein